MTTLEEAVESYLDSHNATLWGRAYDLSDPTSRAEAVLLLEDVVAAVMDQLLDESDWEDTGRAFTMAMRLRRYYDLNVVSDVPPYWVES